MSHSQEWVEEALCAGLEDFLDVPVGIAQAICRTPCPVTAECLAYGLRTRSEGVWGGEVLEGHESDAQRLEAAV